MTLLLVVVGAAIGAPARYLIDRVVQSRHQNTFPSGTLVVNLIASFVLGLTSTMLSSPNLVLLIGTGFCGALSTYSAFSFETVRLAEEGHTSIALINVAATLILGLGCVWIGGSLGNRF